MGKDKPVESRKSSAREDRSGKNFRIPISNGIFEHYAQIRDALWLFAWYVDKTTGEISTPDGSRDGIVLGGKPCSDADVAGAFGCSERTIWRWRQRLVRFGYISQKRTPLGHVVWVRKSKKWLQGVDKNVHSDRTRMSDHSESDSPKRWIRVTEMVNQSHRNGDSRSDSAVQDRDIAVEEAASAFSLLRTKNRETLKKLNLAFQGEPRLLAAWSQLYTDRPADELLSDTMERCIQACKRRGIRIPPPFYQAKRVVEEHEAHEADTEEHLPLLVDPAEKERLRQSVVPE
jgi:hypothetical protein